MGHPPRGLKPAGCRTTFYTGAMLLCLGVAKTLGVAYFVVPTPSRLVCVTLPPRRPVPPLGMPCTIAMGVRLIPEQWLINKAQLLPNTVVRPLLLGARSITPPLLTFTPQQRMRQGLLLGPILSVAKQTALRLLLIPSMWCIIYRFPATGHPIPFPLTLTTQRRV